MTGEGNHQFGLKGELNDSFKQDWKPSPYGYILCRSLTHPLRNCDGFVFAHRLVVEEYLKSEEPGSEYLITIDGVLVLDPNVVIHHEDGDKCNNCISNLVITTLGDHSSMHNEGLEYERNPDGTFRSVRLRVTGPGRLERKHITDAGQDIYSTEQRVIYPGRCETVPTGLRMAIPYSHVGLIWSRSGLSVKHNIEVGAGCIDCGFTGELKVVLYNHGEEPYRVEVGDAIAQLLLVPISMSTGERTMSLETTARGEGGFGSTGK